MSVPWNPIHHARRNSHLQIIASLAGLFLNRLWKNLVVCGRNLNEQDIDMGRIDKHLVKMSLNLNRNVNYKILKLFSRLTLFSFSSALGSADCASWFAIVDPFLLISWFGFGLLLPKQQNSEDRKPRRRRFFVVDFRDTWNENCKSVHTNSSY